MGVLQLTYGGTQIAEIGADVGTTFTLKTAGKFCEDDISAAIVSGHGELPDNFQEVEYLKSTGTQFINTGIPVARNMVIEIDFTIQQKDEKYRSIVGGASGPTSGLYVSAASDGCYLCNKPFTPVLQINVMYSAILYAGNIADLYINGAPVSVSSDASVTFGSPLCLFARNSADQKMVGMIHSCTIFDADGTKIANYIPCYRKSNYAPGMYDTVGGSFYTNAGDGEFIVGPNVVE